MHHHIRTQAEFLRFQSHVAFDKESKITITKHAVSVFERALARIISEERLGRQEVRHLCGSDDALFASLPRCEIGTPKARISAHFVIPMLDILWVSAADGDAISIDRANYLICNHFRSHFPKWNIKCFVKHDCFATSTSAAVQFSKVVVDLASEFQSYPLTLCRKRSSPARQPRFAASGSAAVLFISGNISDEAYPQTCCDPIDGGDAIDLVDVHNQAACAEMAGLHRA